VKCHPSAVFTIGVEKILDIEPFGRGFPVCQLPRRMISDIV
jgi:hypothetical protein